ncbi:hypothetical protein IC582_026562 [Cucumis melo]
MGQREFGLHLLPLKNPKRKTLTPQSTRRHSPPSSSHRESLSAAASSSSIEA